MKEEGFCYFLRFSTHTRRGRRRRWQGKRRATNGDPLHSLQSPAFVPVFTETAHPGSSLCSLSSPPFHSPFLVLSPLVPARQERRDFTFDRERERGGRNSDREREGEGKKDQEGEGDTSWTKIFLPTSLKSFQNIRTLDTLLRTLIPPSFYLHQQTTVSYLFVTFNVTSFGVETNFPR